MGTGKSRASKKKHDFLRGIHSEGVSLWGGSPTDRE